MSLRTFARKALRASGLQTRTVTVSRFNSVTGLRESREETHRLSPTGMVRLHDGRIESTRQPMPSKPGAGWRAKQRREGGGKAARKNQTAARFMGRHVNALTERGSK